MAYKEAKPKKDIRVLDKNEVAPQHDYDPQVMLRKVGGLQDRMIDAVGRLDMDELVADPKLMEGINTLLNGANGTAVQVIRNSIVQANSDIGAVADAVIDRMKERGVSFIDRIDIRDVNSPRGTIPSGVVIDGVEEIEQKMLTRGITEGNFEEFATRNAMTILENDD